MEGHVAHAPTQTLTSRAIGYLVSRKRTVASWVFAVGASVFFTLLRLGDIYAGFFADAAWTSAAVALVLVNIVATIVLILGLRFALQPQRLWLFIAVVAASISVLVNSEIQTGLVSANSTTQIGEINSINVGKFYNPLAERLNRSIDTTVRLAQRKHLAPLIAAYPEPDGATKLQRAFVAELNASSATDEQKTAAKERLQAIVDDPDTSVAEKVRAIGRETYRVFSKAQVDDFVMLAAAR